jgi:hypothetical protein
MRTFDEDNDFSEGDDREWLDSVYRETFGDVAGVTRVQGKCEAQSNGVDVTITLKRDKTIRVDEKLRRKSYNDVALEVVANTTKKSRGWLVKPTTADFIAYAWASNQRCLLLPVAALQRAWRLRGAAWKEDARAGRNGFYVKYGTTLGTSGTVLYQTLNVVVPTHELLAAMAEALCLSGSGEVACVTDRTEPKEAFPRPGALTWHLQWKPTPQDVANTSEWRLDQAPPLT